MSPPRPIRCPCAPKRVATFQNMPIRERETDHAFARRHGLAFMYWHRPCKAWDAWRTALDTYRGIRLSNWGTRLYRAAYHHGRVRNP